MKSPVDTAKGRIVGYDEKRGELLIRATYDDIHNLCKRKYRECLVQLVDSRPLSDKQRRTCYALIREISNYTGMGADPTKEWMKLKFILDDLNETADKIFSLSNAPMSLVCAFQRFLVRFILDWDIPCSFPLLNFVDDVQDYIYACLISKKCCITGQPAQLHHVDRVGMGRDRSDILHEGLEALPLSPELHQEAHTMSDREFFDKYHLPGGIVLDKTLCRIWHLGKQRRGQ
ncbi:putative HNHc nuclease [Pseudoflavonifractor sp. 524-17]|uniref:putative HNHc nuclease n=1 Tax=Pseudoflavonifractor sp. 524-17 TaxID=2304577 RepID=UPI00137B6F1E